MASFDIHINYSNKLLKSLSIKLAIFAFIGFILWSIINYPLRFVPNEFSIPYYFDILPSWLLKVFETTILFGIISYTLYDVRKNLKGVLTVELKSIVIKSKKRREIINFSELLRITAIQKPMTKYPYRLEFIYPDFKFTRIAMKDENKFFQLVGELSKSAPEGFEINDSEFESLD